MPDYVIFWDLGGVLLRTEDRTPRLRLAESLGLTYSELDRLVFASPSARLASLGKVTPDQHWSYVCQEAEFPEENLPAFQEAFWGGDRLDLALVDTVRALHASYRTALLSNNWGNLRRLIEESWKIGDAFDDLIISAEVGILKPDPQIYLYAQEKMAVRPEQAVLIDDYTENIEAARSAGWQAIQFLSSQQAQAELQALLTVLT